MNLSLGIARRSLAQPSRRRASSETAGAHLDARRNRARPRGRNREPIDKVEPTVDSAGPVWRSRRRPDDSEPH